MPEPPPPHRVFAPPQERKATVEALIDVFPDPSVRSSELEPLLDVVISRIGELLEPVEAMAIPARVAVDLVYCELARNIPVFPVTFGGLRLFDYMDVVEVMEHLRVGTPCAGLLRDAAGRAFFCSVYVGFARREEHDRDRQPTHVFILD